jgi:hypothetical protein
MFFVMSLEEFTADNWLKGGVAVFQVGKSYFFSLGGEGSPKGFRYY